MHSIVIVGAGLAGYTLAKEFRKLDKQTPLHIITEDDGHFYSKPMLSNALSKNKTADDLVTTTAIEMAAQLNATIWSNTFVKSIDTQTRTVTTDQQSVNYSKLVLAVGASQIKPPLKGNAIDNVVSVNNLQDYAKFRILLEDAKHVAIIGPGLIGCEFANDIIDTGRSVTVIGPANTPLDRLLPPQAGKALQDRLSQLGVHWHLGVTADSVDRQNGNYVISLSDGEVVAADLVLSAVGLKPNIDLAANAGLAINRGIVVNRTLLSSVEDIYALGDCAEIEGMVLPFVLPIMHAARALAKTLSGNATKLSFPAMPVVIKTPAHSIVVASPPLAAGGDWQVSVEEGGVRALFQDAEQKLLGYVLTGAAVQDKQKLTKELPPVLE
jgi:rubredoxin-NAD+ reductase